MLFNSVNFLIFFPVVVLIYFLMPKKVKYVWLLATSYFFYMCWNAKYALLLLWSTAITYLSGLLIDRCERRQGQESRKKIFVALSFALNLSILFLFKYFDFAIENINYVLGKCHLELIVPKFDLLLPVGISFYIFQALSYTMDVYRKDIYVERNFLKYALFVSFFPQLVAGPIERSKNLLRQIGTGIPFSYENFRRGLLLMLWGYFQKIVIADRIALLVDTVYGNVDQYQGGYFLLASVLFAVQIYCDFAGYSIIAIGTARILGIQLMENFNAPYFAMSVSEFWRRWHITLGRWFREYVYIPMGGSRKGTGRTIWNLFVVWALTGLWHGADWNFVLWGLYFGLWLILERFVFKDLLARTPVWVKRAYTLAVVFVGWGVFAMEDLGVCGQYLKVCFGGGPLWSAPDGCRLGSWAVILLLLALGSTTLALDLWRKLPQRGRKVLTPVLMALGLALSTAYLVDGSYNPFLYFRF